MQVQHEIVRFCANTSLVYFLRTMGVQATAAAATVHDRIITLFGLPQRGWHEAGERGGGEPR